MRKPWNCRRRLLIQNDRKQVVPENIKQVAKDRKTRTWLQNPFLSEEATLSHLTYVIPFQQNKWSGVSCEWLLHFPPAPISAQSVTRIAESGTTVYDRASFVSSSRNSNRDDDEVVTPRPETQHRGHEQKQKRKFGQKGPPDKKKDLFITGIFPARNLFLITVFKQIPKNRRRGKLQSLQFYINSKTKGL